MSESLEHTVPAAQASVPAEPLEVQVEKMRRWFEGYTDEKQIYHPGLFALVGELVEEMKARRERKESLGRALASGGVLAVIGVSLTWLKDHLK